MASNHRTSLQKGVYIEEIEEGGVSIYQKTTGIYLESETVYELYDWLKLWCTRRIDKVVGEGHGGER